MAFLTAETFDFAHSHALNANVAESVLYLFEFERFNNGFDFLHNLCIQRVGWVVPKAAPFAGFSNNFAMSFPMPNSAIELYLHVMKTIHSAFLAIFAQDHCCFSSILLILKNDYRGPNPR